MCLPLLFPSIPLGRGNSLLVVTAVPPEDRGDDPPPWQPRPTRSITLPQPSLPSKMGLSSLKLSNMTRRSSISNAEGKAEKLEVGHEFEYFIYSRYERGKVLKYSTAWQRIQS